jgi:two-component system response regulator NreC
MAANLQLAPSPDPAPAVRAAGKPIRVVLADHHALMRRSLRLLLDREADVEVVAEARDLVTVVCRVRGLLPEVLVLDLGMPGGSSIEVIRRLRAEVPSTQTVVLTMQDNPAFARQALDSGALGFVRKDFADTELPEAVRNAADGREYLSPQVAVQLGSAVRC